MYREETVLLIQPERGTTLHREWKCSAWSNSIILRLLIS
jgi:hypothetical protein